MILDPANIHRSNRRTLALFIDDHGTLIVKAPLKLSDRKIFDFINEKEDWIRRQQQRAAANAYINMGVMTYSNFLFLGNILTPTVSTKCKKISHADGLLFIPEKLASTGESGVLKKIVKYLKDNAKQIVDDRCNYFCQRLSLTHASATTNNNKTRWGVCDLNGNIVLNWRVIMLPPKLIDYIVVHEFCHLLEFNHTREFWNLVEAVLPNWRVLRKELKQQNYLLNLFRKL